MEAASGEIDEAVKTVESETKNIDINGDGNTKENGNASSGDITMDEP